MKNLILFVLICLSMPVIAQSIDVYPTNWWTGMKNQSLQLMIHGTGDVSKAVSISYPGIRIKRITQPSNKHYVFVDIDITASAKPGTFKIRSGNEYIPYQLKQRNPGNGKTRIRGISSEDLIYLVMPDRFSNGDPSNDRVDGMLDQTLNRDSIFHRHGGDLKGIQNHLDYLEDLGVTALWLMPVWENDMPHRSEHGYAFTNQYKVEPRLGGNAAYHQLVDALHERKMKIVQDAVYNHLGIEHFLYRDMPDSTWFHRWPVYTNTSYKDQVLMDPYASQADKKIMSDGWFTPMMPDVNHANPFMANFLIQHAIWTTEEFGVDGWRIDTYAYNDLDFMNRCNKALMDEYPQIHLFGETWVHGIPNQSFFARNKYNIRFRSNLPGVTDFQQNLYGIVPALTQNFGWTEGINRLYLTTTNDYVYADPMKNVIFLDNHDMSRFRSMVAEDDAKLKAGIAWLLTFRGIPQLYYGTEVRMKNYANPDGLVRLDFPGGWSGDPDNKFEASGRSEADNAVFDYTRKIAQFRKSSSAIKSGKMMQFVPENGVYVYFRYDKKQTVMCMMNPENDAKKIACNRFAEIITGKSKAVDIVSGTSYDLNEISVPGKSVLVLELK
jgi:glycosidase